MQGSAQSCEATPPDWWSTFVQATKHQQAAGTCAVRAGPAAQGDACRHKRPKIAQAIAAQRSALTLASKAAAQAKGRQKMGEGCCGPHAPGSILIVQALQVVWTCLCEELTGEHALMQLVLPAGLP